MLCPSQGGTGNTRQTHGLAEGVPLIAGRSAVDFDPPRLVTMRTLLRRGLSLNDLSIASQIVS